MQIICKEKFFTINHVWFENIEKIEKGYDKIKINGSAKSLEKMDRTKCFSSVQETLISDLSIEKEKLWGKLTKTVRNEINRSKRENIEIQFFYPNMITNKLLDEFENMYVGMFESKGIHHKGLSRNVLRSYIQNQALFMSVAYIDSKPVVYHSYVCDKIHVRLLHSCSEFREADNLERNKIGRANKFLHWNDWIQLKDIGVTEYDWGGDFII